jgi:RNA polymerase sigma factor (sigma-70 family)
LLINFSHSSLLISYYCFQENLQNLNLNSLVRNIKDRDLWVEVWARFRKGDRDAFSEIYGEFVDILFAYGRKITSDRELVKDCIQDLFYDLYRYNPNLNHPEYLEFYLFKSLRNGIIHQIKKNKESSSLTDEKISVFDLKFYAEQDLFDEESDDLRIKALKQILQTLNAQKRELLFLKFSTGLNYVEIGHLLDMNPDTVKKQIYRTIESLRCKYGVQLLGLLMIWSNK